MLLRSSRQLVWWLHRGLRLLYQSSICKVSDMADGNSMSKHLSLPLSAGAYQRAVQDCGPDRWGRILIARAVRKHAPAYVLALGDTSALRFCAESECPFLAT